MSDLENLQHDLLALTAQLQTQENLMKLGLAQERRIRQRTRQGLDYLGDAFEPYAESYAKRRERKELPTDKVTLKFSLYDGMLSYLETETTDETATLRITDDDKREIAGYHQEGGENGDLPQREFMGVSDEDKRDLAQLLAGQLDDLLANLNLDT